LTIAMALMGILPVALALVGPWLTGASPDTPVAGPFQPAAGGHLLGTDVLGRDVLARVLVGGRTIIWQAASATVFGSIVGLSVGLWSATTPHTRVARAVLSLIDGIAAVPALLLLLVLAAGAPGDDVVVAVGIALVSVPFSVRINRDHAHRLAATDYARDAQARGEAWAGRIRFDILPGLAPVALSEAGIRFVAATQLAATAGFLGLGSGAPTANWGRMVRENLTGLTANALPVLVPCVLLVTLSVGVTLGLDRAAAARLSGAPSSGDATLVNRVAQLGDVTWVKRLSRIGRVL